MRANYHEYDPAPLSGVIADLIALNQQVQAMERETIEMSIRTLELQGRVNRTLGHVSDATQRFELQARSKKAAPGSTPKAA